MKIGFIGAGKVGTSLGKLFSECGAHITGYYSRSFDHARQAAEFTSSVPYQTLEALVQESDTLFVTTPDGVLQTMIGEIAALPVKRETHLPLQRRACERRVRTGGAAGRTGLLGASACGSQ